MTYKDKQDLWTMAVQALVLSAAFALVFSWETAAEPRMLTLMIVILLVLQYPMSDRLKDWLEKEIIELHKTQDVTELMVAYLLDGLPGKAADERLPLSDKLAKATKLAEQVEKLGQDYEKGFERQLRSTDTYRLDFLVNTFGVLMYLGILIGSAALVGWLVSRLL